jgi:hypothetical protein
MQPNLRCMGPKYTILIVFKMSWFAWPPWQHSLEILYRWSSIESPPSCSTLHCFHRAARTENEGPRDWTRETYVLHIRGQMPETKVWAGCTPSASSRSVFFFYSLCFQWPHQVTTSLQALHPYSQAIFLLCLNFFL